MSVGLTVNQLRRISPCVRICIYRIVPSGEFWFRVCVSYSCHVYVDADVLRPEAGLAMQRLQSAPFHFPVTMLTGDNESVAARVARQLNIGTFHARLYPDQKLQWVLLRQQEQGEQLPTRGPAESAVIESSASLMELGIPLLPSSPQQTQQQQQPTTGVAKEGEFSPQQSQPVESKKAEPEGDKGITTSCWWWWWSVCRRGNKSPPAARVMMVGDGINDATALAGRMLC